jgi:hypothetical protein
LGRFNDYITTPTANPNGFYTKHSFIWWHVGKRSLSNVTKLKQNIIYYDTNLDKAAISRQNLSVNGGYYNVTSNYIPLEYGKWTTPYYDCFGGKTWMITYLAPFYDEADKFL